VLAIRAPASGPGETVPLRPLLARLLAEHGVERIVGEGGGKLNAALIAEDLVGEIFVAGLSAAGTRAGISAARRERRVPTGPRAPRPRGG